MGHGWHGLSKNVNFIAFCIFYSPKTQIDALKNMNQGSVCHPLYKTIYLPVLLSRFYYIEIYEVKLDT